MDIRDRIKEGLSDKITLWEEKSTRRIYFSVRKEDILETARFLFKDLRLRFSTASGMDTPQGFEIIYHFSFDKAGIFFSVRVLIEDKKRPRIDSLVRLFPAAEWIEREMWEMLGIDFSGHPNLKRLLLSDDWPDNEYPLRQENR